MAQMRNLGRISRNGGGAWDGGTGVAWDVSRKSAFCARLLTAKRILRPHLTKRRIPCARNHAECVFP